MSSNHDDDLEGADIWGDSSNGNQNGNGNGDKDDKDKRAQTGSTAAAPASAEEEKQADEPEEQQQQQQQQQQQPEVPQDCIDDDETQNMSISELRQRIHLLDNDIRVMKSDIQRITHETRAQQERIRENQEKVKLNKQLPYLVGNVVEVLEPEAEDGEWHGVVLLGFTWLYLASMADQLTIDSYWFFISHTTAFEFQN